MEHHGDEELNQVIENIQMTDAPELLAKVRTALLNGDIQAALSLSQQVLLLAPSDLDANYLHGLACFHSGDLARAIAVLSPVATAVPNLPSLQTTLGNAYSRLGQFGEAETHFRAAVALVPESLPDLLGLVSVLYSANRIEEATRLSGVVSQTAGRLRSRELLDSELAGQAAPVIFDVGANEGITTRKFLSSFPSATVHAFEPHPALFAKLAAAFPSSENVFINDCGLGSACGTLRFNQSSDLGSSSFLDFDNASGYIAGLKLSTEASMEAKVLTLDSYCRERGVGHIHLLKLDVQGFEPHVLEGSAEMLSKRAVDVIQLEIIFRDFYSTPSSFYDVEKWLKPHGYRLKSVFDIYPGEGSQLFQLDAIYTCKT